MISVSITDDHLLIIKGITELLRQIPEVEFKDSWMTVSETKDKIGSSGTDVLLLDLNLPDGDGVSLCKELTKKYSDLKIIALTTYNQNVLVKNMMRNGAQGFLLKNTSQEELRSAIVDVMNGKQYIQTEIKESLLRDSIGMNKPTNGFDIPITRREKEILKLILEECTTTEIAEKLFISPKTVETHRTHLMDKLGVKNVAGLVKIALEKGLA